MVYFEEQSFPSSPTYDLLSFTICAASRSLAKKSSEHQKRSALLLLALISTKAIPHFQRHALFGSVRDGGGESDQFGAGGVEAPLAKRPEAMFSQSIIHSHGNSQWPDAEWRTTTCLTPSTTHH